MSASDPFSEDEIRSLWGDCPPPDFDAWRGQNAEAVAYLNPVVTELQTRRRRFLMRTFKLTATTLCLALLIWSVGFRGESTAYAEAIRELKSARTITWKHEFFMRATSKDGQRNWLHKMTSRKTYRHPGQYRTENKGTNGKTLSVTIQNTLDGKELSLNPKTKTAVLRDIGRQPDDSGPFDWVDTSMTQNALELVGQRDTGTGTVNVFRHTIQGDQQRETRFHDFWIDTETKQLVQFRNSIDKPLYPETDPDRDKPGEKTWKGTRAMGTIESEIVLDAKLAADMFSLTPPPGYKLENPEKQTVSEKEMLEFLTAAVKFGGNVFPDSPKGLVIDGENYNAIFEKPKAQWSKLELTIADLIKESQLRGGPFPIMHFIQDHAVPGSFCYIGKGVKYGQADRIVCWYKLANGGQYRAVFGDLAVKDIDPGKLPLAVTK